MLDAVIQSAKVSDEVIGFHCQQVAEKLLKAMLSNLGVAFHKTHELGVLMDTLGRSGAPLPGEFENLDALTPFGAVYRYDDYDGHAQPGHFGTNVNLEATGTIQNSDWSWSRVLR